MSASQNRSIRLYLAQLIKTIKNADAKCHVLALQNSIYGFILSMSDDIIGKKGIHKSKCKESHRFPYFCVLEQEQQAPLYILLK